jgi:hypothetical protein
LSCNAKYLDCDVIVTCAPCLRVKYRIVPAECLDVPQPDRLLGFLQGLRLTYSQGIREKQDGG